MQSLYKTNFNDIPLLKRGKVRDVYDLGEYLLIVATDRISAFDVIMEQPIPNKGKVLTQISNYWFNNTKHIISNHLTSTDVNEYPAICHKYKNELENRSMLVRKTNPILLECVVRNYIAGSGWKEYLSKSSICGIDLPNGLTEYGKLPHPIFTPSTKADVGHDENIDFMCASEIIGKDIAIKVKEYSLELFNYATTKLLNKGIILADTKFEFGIDNENNIILIDEVLTPDSSRFWLLSDYEAGKTPYNFDKQVLRDYLESIVWNKQPPPPTLPPEIINKTIDRYNFISAKIIEG